jgi:hypothetical protein
LQQGASPAAPIMQNGELYLLPPLQGQCMGSERKRQKDVYNLSKLVPTMAGFEVEFMGGSFSDLFLAQFSRRKGCVWNDLQQNADTYCRYVKILIIISKGRAIPEAVTRRLTTTAARARPEVKSCGICGGQSGIEFGFPCQFSFHRLLHTHHHLSSGAGTIGQIEAHVPSGLSLTPPQERKEHIFEARNEMLLLLSL